MIWNWSYLAIPLINNVSYSRSSMNPNAKYVISVIAIVIAFAVSSQGQAPATEAPPPPPQQRHFGGDPVRQLNLTPEQREQIRLIREQLRNERAVVNQRVRETNK